METDTETGVATRAASNPLDLRERRALGRTDPRAPHTGHARWSLAHPGAMQLVDGDPVTISSWSGTASGCCARTVRDHVRAATG